MLRDGLASLEEYFVLSEATENIDQSWFGFLLTVKENSVFTRDQIVHKLESKGIPTRMLFAGNLIKHPCFDEMRKEGKGYRMVVELKVTDQIMHNTFWVGVYPVMNNNAIDYIIETMTVFIYNKK